MAVGLAEVDPAAPREDCMTGIMDWESSRFSIVTTEGEKTVNGLVNGAFGIHGVGEIREHWTVTHIPTGLKLTRGKGFLAVESAKTFVDKISQKANWESISSGNPPRDLGMAVTEIWNEVVVEDCLRMVTVPTFDPSSRGPSGTSLKHVGRNDHCPCGSGKKFKKCCLH